jgi:hypothetical protein
MGLKNVADEVDDSIKQFSRAACNYSAGKIDDYGHATYNRNKSQKPFTY